MLIGPAAACFHSHVPDNAMRPLALHALLLLPVASTAAEPVEPDQIRATVQKSLPYLAERGDWWRENKNCVSCHRGAFQVWSHSLAGKLGLKVDQEELGKWSSWVMERLRDTGEGETPTAEKNMDGVAQLLAALNADKPAEADTRQLVEWLESGQKEDGSWKPYGQLPKQKRPLPETTTVSTLWNVILGRDFGLSEQSQSSAAEYLKTTKKGISTEWLLLSILYQSDRDPSAAQELLKQLEAEQNDDGGWGWIRKEESDAIVTGQALYVFRRLRDAVKFESEISALNDRAVRYLLASQTDDGSWPTKGTKKNRKDKIEETATYWGSGWAAIGLLYSLPN